MKPTSEQAEIYDAGASLKKGDALKVIAFAGAGKTTTLKGIAERRNERGSYLAFNKSIAAEAKMKLRSTRCGASTMHSLAFQAMKDVMGQPQKINARSLMQTDLLSRFHTPRVKGWGEYRVAAAVCRTMTAFSNSDKLEIDRDHAREALMSSVGDPDFLKTDDKKAQAQEALDAFTDPLVEIAEAYWLKCIENGDYSHDMYLKALDLNEGIREDAFARLKYLMIDEAQDINPVQRSIIEKTGLPLIAVGDPYQQIYSWRGAENALDKLPGKELYLTQSFRFGENIAELARHMLSIRPDGGPDQHLSGAGDGSFTGHTGPRAAIICRTNIGMLDEAIRCIDKNFDVHVDKMEDLVSDARSAQALFEGRTSDVTSQDLKQFDSWEEMEIAAEEGDPGFNKLVKLVTQNRVGHVEMLNARHKSDPDDAKVMICTGHRSKGLEFPAVKMAEDWSDVKRLSSRYEKATEKSDKHVTSALEEYNLLYVAGTRAIARLNDHERILWPKVEPEDDAVPVDEEIERERAAQPD